MKWRIVSICLKEEKTSNASYVHVTGTVPGTSTVPGGRTRYVLYGVSRTEYRRTQVSTVPFIVGSLLLNDCTPFGQFGDDEE
jgi:hypothetical protein